METKKMSVLAKLPLEIRELVLNLAPQHRTRYTAIMEDLKRNWCHTIQTTTIRCERCQQIACRVCGPQDWPTCDVCHQRTCTSCHDWSICGECDQKICRTCERRLQNRFNCPTCGNFSCGLCTSDNGCVGFHVAHNLRIQSKHR